MGNGNEGTIVLYQTDDGKVAVNVRFENETFWLTQKTIAELFDTERSVIAKHLINIYEEEELNKSSTCAKIAQDQTEGARNRRRVLEGKGKVSHEDAVKKAEDIYAQFRVRQDEKYISEFDREMVKYLKGDRRPASCSESNLTITS